MKARTQTSLLPEAIRSYWEAANSQQAEAACASFTSDAVVMDEGETLHGSLAIHTWIRKTTEVYRPLVEPLHLTKSGGKHLVTARVSGSFPGSPVELDFAFTLREDKICHLEVQ